MLKTDVRFAFGGVHGDLDLKWTSRDQRDVTGTRKEPSWWTDLFSGTFEDHMFKRYLEPTLELHLRELILNCPLQNLGLGLLKVLSKVLSWGLVLFYFVRLKDSLVDFFASWGEVVRKIIIIKILENKNVFFSKFCYR